MSTSGTQRLRGKVTTLPAGILMLTVSQSSLKDVVEKKVIEKQKEVKDFRTAHGDTKVGEVTVNMVPLASVH